MATPTKVSGTKLRGTTYHLNIPIPAPIRHLYGGKAAFEKSTGSSDPKEAARQVMAQRTEFNTQVKDAQRKADQARLKKLLDPADAAAVEALGGAQNLPKTIADLRKWMAFRVLDHAKSRTGPMDRNPEDEEDGEQEEEILPPGVTGEIEIKARLAAYQAFQDTITAEIRKLKGVATTLGEAVPPAPAFIDEGVSGVRELAERMAGDRGYTNQLRDALRYTVRRWIELHGEIPITKWQKAHLSAFADALKGLPISREKRVQDLPIREAIEIATLEGLETAGDKIRQTRVDHMKSLSIFAMNQLGLIEADPFAKFTVIKKKVRHSEQSESDVNPFSPAQVRLILGHCAAKFHEDTLDRWAPVIAAMTAARREEIGQLYLTNVEDRGNGLMITITDAGEDQKVKNKHSHRTIPVPQALMDAGFGDFVARRRTQGGKMLFLEDFTANRSKVKALREVQSNKRGRFTETYGERFNRSVKKPLGLVDEGLVFHSFRHAWTDAARRAKIDPEIRRLIAGRLDGEDATESSYGGADLLQEKLEAMEAVIPFLTRD